MKQYHLTVYNGGNTEQVLVQAEAHTFDNNMIIFWKTTKTGEWAQIAMYPASRTALIRIEGPNVADQTFVNQTLDIVEPTPELPKMTAKSKTKK